MTTEFERFEEISARLGSGREVGTTRQIPVFVPEGAHQSALTDASIKYLSEQRGFSVLDLRVQSPEKAVASFSLIWPELSEKWPDTEFEQIAEQNRLLIAGGVGANDVFWRMLAGESLLYAGSSLPPSSLSPRCVVVPDNVALVAIVCLDNFRNYRLEYFGAACRFNTNQVPFDI